MKKRHAIVLCSGGIDSVTTAHYVKKKLGYKGMSILFFNYRQKSISQERLAAKKCARNLDAEFIEADLKWLGEISDSLINKKGKVKRLSRKDLKNTKKESEKWYVPCRNTVFLSYAIAFAESFFIKKRKICDIFVGFKNEGKEAYPDSTKKFVNEINRLKEISSIAKGRIKAPLMNKDKEDIIRMGLKIGVNFKDTFSCYTGVSNGKGLIHCGYCLACMLRKEGFYWASQEDPAIYCNERNSRNSSLLS